MRKKCFVFALRCSFFQRNLHCFTFFEKNYSFLVWDHGTNIFVRLGGGCERHFARKIRSLSPQITITKIVRDTKGRFADGQLAFFLHCDTHDMMHYVIIQIVTQKIFPVYLAWLKSIVFSADRITFNNHKHRVMEDTLPWKQALNFINKYTLSSDILFVGVIFWGLRYQVYRMSRVKNEVYCPYHWFVDGCQSPLILWNSRFWYYDLPGSTMVND